MSVRYHDIARFKRRKKSRWGPEGEKPPVVASIHAIPTVIPLGITTEQLESLMVRIRIEELGRKVNMNELDIDWTAEKSPSPEPIYDTHGKRVNTREQRAKDRLIAERQKSIDLATSMWPNFKPPADYTPSTTKKLRKVYVPVEKFPEYNFIGLIIGPRGNTQKRMEKETGAKISIRGRGSAKDGKKAVDDNEPLHVLLAADTEAALEKATKAIHKLLVPIDEGANEHKRQQLRELAEINGTLRDYMWMHPDEMGRSFEPAKVKCSICGDASHPTSDCQFKTKGVLPTDRQQHIDNEYNKFLSEIGEGPTAADPYEAFMNSIKGEAPAPWDAQPPAAPAPWDAAPAPAAPWNSNPAPPPPPGWGYSTYPPPY